MWQRVFKARNQAKEKKKVKMVHRNCGKKCTSRAMNVLAQRPLDSFWHGHILPPTPKMRIEFILFRTPSLLSPSSRVPLACWPCQPKCETFRAQLPTKSTNTVCLFLDAAALSTIFFMPFSVAFLFFPFCARI